MNKTILLILIGVLLIAGCETKEVVKVTCNKPYILVGTSCCLDQNDNNICDGDEVEEESKVEVKEEKEPAPKVEEKPKEYTVLKLKDNIDDIYNKVHIWELETDKLDADITYHAYISTFEKNIIIAEIKNKNKYLNDYDDFLKFDFNYNYNESLEKEWANKTFKVENITNNNLDLTIGKINEIRGYWEEDLGTRWTYHSFNVYCAPNIYIKINPDWSDGFGSTGVLGFDNYMPNAFHQFDSDRKKILPKVSEILGGCPLMQNEEIYDLEQSIGKNYVFLKEGSEQKITHHSLFDEENIIIDEIKDKDVFLDIGKFKEYVTNQFDTSMKKSSRGEFEEEMKKDSWERKDYVPKEHSMYYRYINHTLDKNILFNNITILTEINSKLIETKFASYDKYNVLYNKSTSRAGIEHSRYTETQQKINVDLMQKMSILCKPNIVINFLSYDFDYPIHMGSQDEQTNIGNVKNQVKENREELLTEASKILKVCS